MITFHNSIIQILSALLRMKKFVLCYYQSKFLHKPYVLVGLTVQNTTAAALYKTAFVPWILNH